MANSGIPGNAKETQNMINDIISDEYDMDDTDYRSTRCPLKTYDMRDMAVDRLLYAIATRKIALESTLIYNKFCDYLE
jgi:hypothetical protein